MYYTLYHMCVGIIVQLEDRIKELEQASDLTPRQDANTDLEVYTHQTGSDTCIIIII